MSSPALAIRPARPADAAAICVVHRAAVRRLCARHYSRAQIQAWVGPRRPTDYLRAMWWGGERMLVALRNCRVVGFAALHGDELRALYVDPWRGRGCGLALLRAAERQAWRRGVRTLRLQATLNAAGFYRRAGYETTRHGEVRRGAQVLAVIEMAARLSNRRAG